MQINRNMSAVVANNQLLGIEERLSASIERLSSGLKINRASDNPAGMAISNKMKAQIDALDQAEANAADGISVVQIADGALNEVSSILQRMRELSVQAANGINSFNDRQSMQDEVDELVKEVDRISADTEYNTKKLLDGSSNVRVYGENGSRYQVSDSVDAKVYSLNVESVATQATVSLNYEIPQEDASITINGVDANITKGMSREAYLETVRNAATEAGCSVKIEGNQMLIHSDYYGYEEELSVSVTEELAVAAGITSHEDCEYVADEKVYKVDTTGVDAVVTIPTQLEASGFTTTTTVECTGNRVVVTDNDGFSIDFLLDEDYEPTADAANGNFEIDVTDIGSLTIQIGANEYQTMDVRIDEISAYTLYLDCVDVAVENGADRAMQTLDDAIAKVSATRSRIGAFQNRLEYAEKSLSSSVENITAAYSGLLDTDMAEEMTEYTQQNILNQAAISVLSQANELPQQILSMLQ
ncbi:MAG: flagellin [Agathobacter sp.]|nr:flagellin [Agathobacter sp.]